jgi:hypothetical protein
VAEKLQSTHQKSSRNKKKTQENIEIWKTRACYILLILLDIFFLRKGFEKQKQMTTDYKNLTLFEAASVLMVAFGVALIGFQMFLALPNEAKTEVASAIQVLEMSHVWETQMEVNEFVFGGMEEFYKEFYIALVDVMEPVNSGVDQIADSYSQIAYAVTEYSEMLASNYNHNYVSSGVETNGGNVLGAFIEKLSQ